MKNLNFFHAKRKYSGDLSEDIQTVTGFKMGAEDTNAKSDYEKYLQAILLCIPKPKIALDVGCGYGRLTNYIPNCIGIDISESLVLEASRRYPESTFRSYSKDKIRYPIESATVDFLFSHATFLHLKNYTELVENLKEIERVLSKGTGIAHVGFRIVPARTKTKVKYFKQFSNVLLLIFQKSWMFFPYIKRNNDFDGIIVDIQTLQNNLKGINLNLLSIQIYPNEHIFYTLRKSK
jgi:SAM-dependent methyltransferase